MFYCNIVYYDILSKSSEHPAHTSGVHNIYIYIYIYIYTHICIYIYIYTHNMYTLHDMRLSLAVERATSEGAPKIL